VSRIVTRICGVWMLLELETATAVDWLAAVVASDLLASLAAEIKEWPMRITELSRSFWLWEDLARCLAVCGSSSWSSLSESVRYESISRNSARIFEFLILCPVSHEAGVVTDRN
jgi:hypothetical protein